MNQVKTEMLFSFVLNDLCMQISRKLKTFQLVQVLYLPCDISLFSKNGDVHLHEIFHILIK